MQTFTWKEWQSFLFVVESDTSKWEKMVLRLQEDDNHEPCPKATFLMGFKFLEGCNTEQTISFISYSRRELNPGQV